MTYSLDFRLHVLHVKKEKDLSFCETAKRFGVGIASIVRWVKKPEPQTHRHKLPTKLNMDALKQDIELYPDAYQYERGERLGVSSMGIWHALKRLNVTYKKNTQASQSRSGKTVCFLPKTESL
jgi:transposase